MSRPERVILPAGDAALPADGSDDLLDLLAGLVDCGNAEGYTCITARREHGLKAVQVEQPAMAILLRGRKQVDGQRTHMQFTRGDLLLLHRRGHLDIENIPDPEAGLYLTLTIPFCAEVLEAARLLWQEPMHDDGTEFARYRTDMFASQLRQWAKALQAGHYGEARSVLAALALMFCRDGHAALLQPPPPTVASQVRALVCADPAREWQSADFEQALTVSGATLRRRLASEHTRLRDVVQDARMACALTLLSSTRLPVKSVAARVGYRSPGSFTRRFSDRYGIDPSAIGNSRPE